MALPFQKKASRLHTHSVLPLQKMQKSIRQFFPDRYGPTAINTAKVPVIRVERTCTPVLNNPLGSRAVPEETLFSKRA